MAASSMLAGCAHQSPDITAANNREVVDVAEEHPRLSSIGEICADRDMLCILAGIAIFGGTIAAIKGANE
ncbi:hypothetical protein [Hyphomicrobium sp. CS1GBMeth3]|uniref:hypothetical protein n=1 Tax=Hyphomicrobium sp. CS1GBMeth3 TaxID=1892845 RepID=UPI0015C5714E|nr:hypothetical protein [Hyphomicrobium sp. CS1GBMeth3]